MTTVFGFNADARSEDERRVPPAGWTSDPQERRANGQYGIPTRPPAPEGWSPAAWRLYLDDPDGGRAACRTTFHLPPDTTPTFAEMMSREDED